MQHIYNNIQGWFDFEYLYQNIVKQSEENSHFVEIGSYLGKSTSYMAVEIANSNKKIRFDAIDTWLGSIEHVGMIPPDFYEQFLYNIDPIKQFINPVRMESKEAVKLYEDNSLDFVFIDASHDYENVKQDINLWYPKVKSKGMIAGHDYTQSWSGVIKAVDEFVDQKNYNLTIKGPTCWGFYKR